MAGWSLDHAYVWHVYAMIGKLTRRSYLLSPSDPT